MPNSQTKLKTVEEVRHNLNIEIAGLAGMLNGSLIHDSGQAHIANMKLGKILEYVETLTHDREHIERVMVERLEAQKRGMFISDAPGTSYLNAAIPPHNQALDHAITLVKEVLQGK